MKINVLKKAAIISVVSLFSFAAMSQEDQKVAVFNPAGSANDGMKEIVREVVSSVVVNTDGYMVLERQLIDRVLSENRFQGSGLVDDSQIVEMGKLMGATLALVPSVSNIGNNFFISGKMIDVQTGLILKQRTGQTQSGIDDLVPVVQAMINEMLFGATENIVIVPDDKLSFYFEGYNNLVKEEHGGIHIVVSMETGTDKVRTVTDSRGNTRQEEYTEWSNKVQLGSGTLREGFQIAINSPERGKYRIEISASTSNFFGRSGPGADAVINDRIAINTAIKTVYELAVHATTSSRGITTYRFVLK